MVNVGDRVYIIHDNFDIVPAIVQKINKDGRMEVNHQSNGTCDQNPWQISVLRYYHEGDYFTSLDQAKVKVLQNIDEFLSKKIRNYQGD